MNQTPDHKGVTAAVGAKARIERAAVTLFADRGADVVTTREIASAAGVSEGAIYRHYPSKVALAATLRMVQLERLAEDIRARTGNGATAEDLAAAIVDGFVLAARRDWSLFCYSFLTANAAPRKARESADPVGVIENRVQRAMDAGALPKGDAALKAAMAAGAILQIARHKKEGRLSGAFPRYADAMKNSVCALLRAKDLGPSETNDN